MKNVEDHFNTLDTIPEFHQLFFVLLSSLAFFLEGGAAADDFVLFFNLPTLIFFFVEGGAAADDFVLSFNPPTLIFFFVEGGAVVDDDLDLSFKPSSLAFFVIAILFSLLKRFLLSIRGSVEIGAREGGLLATFFKSLLEAFFICNM